MWVFEYSFFVLLYMSLLFLPDISSVDIIAGFPTATVNNLEKWNHTLKARCRKAEKVQVPANCKEATHSDWFYKEKNELSYF